MTVLRPIATELRTSLGVRFVPTAEVALCNRVLRTRVRSPLNEYVGDAFENCFALFVAQDISVSNDPSIRFGFRFAYLQNRHFQIEFITRAHRVRQFHLVPTQSHEHLKMRLKLTSQKDVNREGM